MLSGNYSESDQEEKRRSHHSIKSNGAEIAVKVRKTDGSDKVSKGKEERPKV